MDEQNNNIFGTSGEVDLGSAELPQGFDPFASAPVTETATREEAQTPPAPTQSQVKNASEAPPAPKPKVNPVPATLENPLTQAMEAAETKDAEAAKDSIYTRAPKFAYAGVSEDIKEPMKTFEDLRIEKSSDFPELEDGKRVSWTVEYGKITKSVSDPKGTSVGKMKTEIETSKAFLDALKKMKPADREKAVCKIKPRITAQSKGELSEYKDVFPSLEAARASDKIICLIPAQDGRLYEMRKTPMGTFTTPAGKVAELPQVEAGFVPAFPSSPPVFWAASSASSVR